MIRRWLGQLGWRFARFMQGRYGTDILSRDLCWMAIGFWAISLLLRWPIFIILYWFCVFFSLFRSFSKNFSARQKELERYEKLMAKPRLFFRQKKRQWQERKTHKHFRCKCGTVLRVPKGKGKIKLHCSKCGAEMIRKS